MREHCQRFTGMGVGLGMGKLYSKSSADFLKQGSAAGIFGMQDTAVGLFELLHCERCTRYTSDADSEVVINTKIQRSNGRIIGAHHLKF